MKAEGRRDVQIRIDVMHVVEPPQEAHPMRRHMPPVEQQVHQQHRRDELRRRRQRDDVDQAEGRG
jgi:hypothetical protein